MKVVLHLTTACNLRCTYCYAPREGSATMSRRTAKAAIDLAIAEADGSACVSFFGGEPLLQLDRIRELTGYALSRGEQTGTRMHFRLSTNGTLFDEESLAFCRDHRIFFAISVDGDREAHDSARVFADGRGSFEVLDRKLDLILEHNPYTVVASVITPASAGRLLASVEYLWSRGIRYLAHQPAYNDPRWDEESFAVLEQSYRELAAFYLTKARAGEPFLLTLFDEKLKTHAHAPINPGDTCDFGARKVSVAPDGRIFPCVQFVSDKPGASEYCIGSVERGFSERRQELISWNRQQRPQCAGCAFLGRCGSYCACMNWQLTGEILEVPGILCAHERMLIPIADEIGNQLWDEGNRTFLRKHYEEYEERFPYFFD